MTPLTLQPKLSIALVCYEMAAQVENTLRSLLPPYQRGITTADYEIVLVDNGSANPLPERVSTLSPNIRYIYLSPEKSKPSPAMAINQAAAAACGEWLALMIDGARMVTPGVLSWALRLLEVAPHSIVEVRGWHLGPKFQPESVAEGYDHEAEARLLDRIDWLENGYRLFDISSASAQTRHGMSEPASESNCLFMARKLFQQLGGMDERYKHPGGGFVNIDFFSRAAAAAERIWTLLGEGTFHQVHGGAATGLTMTQLRTQIATWQAESLQLRGRIPAVDRQKCVLAGHLPEEFLRWLGRVLEQPTAAVFGRVE